MPWQRPTIDQLIDRVSTDIRGGLGVLNVLRRTFLGVFARAIAGVSHLLHGYLEYLSQQILPDTAEKQWLLRWGAIFGIFPVAATLAEFTITITGSSGGVVPEGEIYQRGDGVQYQLVSEVTIPVGGSVTGSVVALESGKASNLESGDKISLLSPIANVNSEATVDQITTVAADAESDDSYRARVLTRMSLPPLGGAAHDYIAWAKEVAGVTRAWVLPLYTGAGTVSVAFVCDDEDDIIPAAPKVAEVQAYIDALKPVTAILTVFAPVPDPMALNIKIKPNTQEVKDNIISELQDLIDRDATVAGSYKGPGQTNDGSILLSKIRQAVSIAVGLDDYEIQTINGATPANVVPASGHLVTLGSITWQTLP
jgi:uncharacterized phage protein gp47/JayE